MTESQVHVFVRQVRSRSKEHKAAMEVLSKANLVGQMVAVLRQELDSLVRVIYLVTQDLERREGLVDAAVSGEKWTQTTKNGKEAKVTDKDMVDLAQKLFGWTRYVYKFGCAFIHLSNLHDYKDRDPFDGISQDERDDVLGYCRQYHGGPAVGHDDFASLVPYVPNILEKVSDNLECYLEDLENGEVKKPRDV